MPPLLKDEWQWVVVDSKGANKDKKTRQTVRSYAMKSFRRNERLERSKKYKALRARSEKLPEQRHLQPHPGLCRLGIPSPVSSLYMEPDLDLGPFSSTTVQFNCEARRLWFHFINCIAVQLQPVGIRSECNAMVACIVPQALHYPGFATSVLYHSSAHVDALLNRPWTRTTLFYRGETMRHIKEHLSSGGSEVSDSLLAMVAFLAGEGNVSGNIDPDHSHARAIQIMVEIRGGLSAISLTRAPLAMSLAIGDLIRATISGQAPSLIPPSITTNPLLASLPPAFLSTMDTMLPISSPTPLSPHSIIITLTHTISTLSTIQTNLTTSPTTTTSSILSFTNICLAIEHRLLSLQIPYASSRPEPLLDEATRHALLLCMNTLFRTFRPASPIILASQKRLQNALDGLDVSSLEKRNNDDGEKQLLWLLCVGGVTCDVKGGEWYVDKIVELFEKIEVRGESVGNTSVEIERLRGCMQGFVWGAKLDGAAFAALWDRICDKRSCKLPASGDTGARGDSG